MIKLDMSTATAEELALIEGIQKHASKNYNKDGWDYLVECWERDELLADIRGIDTYDGSQSHEPLKTLEDCIKFFGDICSAKDDYRKDVQAEAF